MAQILKHFENNKGRVYMSPFFLPDPVYREEISPAKGAGLFSYDSSSPTNWVGN